MRKLVKKKIGFMFLLDLLQGVGGKCGRLLKLDILFWGIVAGRFKCGKMG